MWRAAGSWQPGGPGEEGEDNSQGLAVMSLPLLSLGRNSRVESCTFPYSTTLTTQPPLVYGNTCVPICKNALVNNPPHSPQSCSAKRHNLAKKPRGKCKRKRLYLYRDHLYIR